MQKISWPGGCPILEKSLSCHTVHFRVFNDKGDEVKRMEFRHGGDYVAAHKEGSFELYGDRVLKLGTNM